MNLYYFTHIKGIQKMVQPVYAKHLDEATSIIEGIYANRYATSYNAMQWPVIQSRMEKHIGEKLTILEPLNTPTFPEGA